MDARQIVVCLVLSGLVMLPFGCGKQEKVVEGLGLQMIRVAPGTFLMGSPEWETGRNEYEKRFFVTISKEYWLGKYEVTQREWKAVMGSNPSYYKGYYQLPVEQVSWDDAMAFCAKVTERERSAGRLPEGYVYTLPTEAQWEYACRAGSTEAYAGDLDAMAWYCDNSGLKTHPVGEKKANTWGFHDMHGNVREWCSDWYYGNYPGGSATDPKGPSLGLKRVLRGGYSDDGAWDCRSATRDCANPSAGRGGFRLCYGKQDAAQVRDDKEKVAIAGAKASPKREAVAANILQNRAGVIYIVNGQEPFRGLAQDFYANGQMQWEAEIEAGKVTTLKRWHGNGVLELSCGFTAGTLGDISKKAGELLQNDNKRLDGEFSAFYDNGQKLLTVTFANGIKVDEGFGIALIRVAPGTFQMGSPASEDGRNGDETQHAVTISKEYWLGRYEVTQGEWASVMGSNPSLFTGDSRLPVEQVSWNDAMEFCQQVTAAERNAGRLPSGYAYTLPTEAQWEYACRAGSTAAYAGELEAMAWYCRNSGTHTHNSGAQTHPVGTKTGNAWGFGDMHGNVMEWCSDYYGEYPNGSAVDPEGPAQGSARVYRGGGWICVASDCRSAFRLSFSPGIRDDHLGFRLCLAPVR